MSKRSDFEKIEKDFYPTTDDKVIVSEFVKRIRGKTYAEPCYGYGDLEHLLMPYAKLKFKSDIRVTLPATKIYDAMDLKAKDLDGCDLIITNPPFTRSVLLPMIDKFISMKPTWLLLPADYMHNAYFRPYMNKCTCVVSIGRVCWFKKEGKRVASTDNFAWYFWPHKASGDSDTTFLTGG